MIGLFMSKKEISPLVPLSLCAAFIAVGMTYVAITGDPREVSANESNSANNHVISSDSNNLAVTLPTLKANITP